MNKFTISSGGGDAGPHHEIVMRMQGSVYYPTDRTKHKCTVHIENEFNIFLSNIEWYYCEIRGGSTYALIDPATIVVRSFDSLSLGVLE